LELLDGLKRERELGTPSKDDQKNFRLTAEKVIGPDENLFRIDWV
jgi:paired amphipathic helix protein Sin3a